jgi:hypothetical protein
MRLIAALFFLPILCLAQSQFLSDLQLKDVHNDLVEFAMADGNANIRSEKVLKFVHALSDKKDRFSSDTDFLQHVFQQTHRRFLKHYQPHTTFSSMLENATYNCLTATALYTILLDQFGYDFNIVETNYHIFILANVNGQQVLLESTDPLNGFIRNADDIASRINEYKSGGVTASSSKRVYYQYHGLVFNTISKGQLRGLIHYNLSVDAYNEKDLSSSTEHFVSAYTLYPSSRLEEFSQILQLTIAKSDLHRQQQRLLLSKIQSSKRASQNQVISMMTQ